ncbi:CvpA family protein [Porphyromonas sp.]|uniref:CvpA family protein n=1 Tax=Porphyromonas sp. TaxID=1924944 RepID=UPI0026DCA4FE|nr:CvpA family protein [Porphyromonas sp.]MDO4695770.1 CvpA family protein [Porphyromonas sp.]MDO4770667.1 CvpA family protein [Porphyromonas sp.]
MHWLDIVLSVLLIVATLKGLLDGFVKQVISIVAIVLAVYLGLTYGSQVGALVITGNADPMVIAGVGGLIVFLIAVMIGVVVQKSLGALFNTTPLGIINRLLGAILAFCGTVILLSALIAAWDAIVTGMGWTFNYEKMLIYPKLLELFKTIWYR